MKDENKRKLAQEWFCIGIEDFKFAKSSFDDFDEFYSNICVQCHQAVEKYLKGYLVFRGIVFPYIHDLDKLLQICIKEQSGFKKFSDDVEKISGYYIVLRYPVHYKERQRRDAEEALEVAEKIIDYIDGLV